MYTWFLPEEVTDRERKYEVFENFLTYTGRDYARHKTHTSPPKK